MITLKIADLDDIEETLKLHQKYQVDFIAEADKVDGFVTTPFSKEELEALIEKEQGLFIAKNDEKVVAYVMAASWQFWSAWPMFAYMIEHMEQDEYLGQKLTVDNSYQYGPICIDKKYRGTRLLEGIFDFARTYMAKRYPILVTFINKINTRSYMAHKKLGLEVVKEFKYNSKNYYELCYDTSKSVK